MATLNYTYTGARNIEGVNQARAVYNAAAAAEAAAKNPPETFTPLTREQYLTLVLDNALRSWKRHYADKISLALAPTQAAALAAAQADLDAVTGGAEGA